MDARLGFEPKLTESKSVVLTVTLSGRLNQRIFKKCVLLSNQF